MKKILLILPVFLLMGCTVNYNLEINKNSIDETINGTVDYNEYEGTKNDTAPTLFYSLIENGQSAIHNGSELYQKNIKKKNNNIEYEYTYTYNNNYDKSNVINSCFENHEIYENDDYYHIKLSGDFYCLYSDKINITVHTDMVVLETNAKKISDDTYEWQINDNKNIDIYMNVVKDTRNTSKKELGLFNIIKIIGLILLGISVPIVYFMYKRNNGK